MYSLRFIHAVRVAPAPKGVGRDLAKQNGIVDIEARQLLARADLLEQQVMGHVPPPPTGLSRPPGDIAEGTKTP